MENFFFYTGEIFICILTFGGERPRWHYDAAKSDAKPFMGFDMSFWIGLAFWLGFLPFIMYVLSLAGIIHLDSDFWGPIYQFFNSIAKVLRL